MIKWFLGILGVIVVIILLVVLVFRRPSQPARPSENQPAATAMTLKSLAAESAEVRYTIQGRIVSQEEHRSVRMTVSNTTRRLEVLQGYEGTVVSSTDLNNTAPAFETFLAALDQAGFARTKESKIQDETGVCPTGRRYIFEVRRASEQVVRSWITSCGNEGTFAGNRATVEQLFKNQIPNYNRLVSGVKL